MTKILAAALLLILTAPVVHADGDYFSPTDDRVRISLGAMYVFPSTNVRVDSQAGVVGTYINGEEDFGLDKSDFEPKFQAMVRLTPRQRLSVDYFTLDRSGNTNVDDAPLRYRDVAFPPGAPLRTKVSMRTFGLTYGYSFWHSETLEIAVTLGVHITDLSSEVRTQTSTLHIVQTDDQAGPIPTLGLDGTWVISKRFYVDARAQYVTAHAYGVDASLGFYDVDLLYRIRPNVSFGVGFTAIDAHLNSTRSTNTGYFDFKSNGPEMFFRVAF